MKLLGALGLVFLFSQTVAFAQTPPVRPIDKPTLPTNGVFDTAGVKLGMTPAEVEAVVKQTTPNATMRRYQNILEVSDNRGNKVPLEYLSNIEINSSDDAAGSNERIAVIFTTSLTETRAVSIDREVSWSNRAKQPNGNALMDDIRQKYGDPSFEISGRPTNWSYLNWVWFKDQRVTFPANDKRRLLYGPGNNRGNPESCVGGTHFVAPYQFSAERTEPAPGCSALITIKVYHNGDLVPTVEFSMVDKNRYMQNARITDEWFSSEIAKKQGAEAPRARPRL